MHWDVDLFYSINGLAGHWPWLDEFMRLMSRPGTYFIPGLFALVYWYYKKGRQAVVLALVLAALIGLADVTGNGVKQLIARPRPCQVLTGVKKITGCGRAYGFPSNHAVNSAAAAMFFQLIYPKAGLVIWPIVALLGFNRVYVGGHYLTDVLGGWLFGVINAWLVVRFARSRRWIKFRQESCNKDDTS
ncbi:MAG: phosphatase PAP2 family protein [Candidatus Binatia bacterium]